MHSLHPCVALLDEHLLLGQLGGQTRGLQLLESLRASCTLCAETQEQKKKILGRAVVGAWLSQGVREMGRRRARVVVQGVIVGLDGLSGLF